MHAGNPRLQFMKGAQVQTASLTPEDLQLQKLTKQLLGLPACFVMGFSPAQSPG